ncbi:MAG: hypothetical protein IJ881_07375 [Neisseriaceae bacterium]|nr:hypothetical protein [Neisseriaceae bacterium]MBR3425319.1 hypothetical protein [Neisseriaceae bacterium]
MKLSDFINNLNSVQKQFGDFELELSAYSQWDCFDKLFRGLTVALDDEIIQDDNWENLLNILQCRE